MDNGQALAEDRSWDCRVVKKLIRACRRCRGAKDLRVLGFPRLAFFIHRPEERRIRIPRNDRRAVNDLGANAGVYHGNGGSGATAEERVSGCEFTQRWECLS